jgi:zinc and cadmium transporter
MFIMEAKRPVVQGQVPRSRRGAKKNDMITLAWIVAGGLAMGAISLVGSLTLLLDEETQRRLTRPLVAFAAGSLLGGALLHMIPEASAQTPGMAPYVSVLAGFSLFLAIEQFLHWHHCHRETADCRPPLGHLILVGDGLHNLLGGLAVGAAFVADLRVGLTSWLAAAAHEVPQDLGDFGVLVHGGWSRRRALVFNLLSSSTFSWAASWRGPRRSGSTPRRSSALPRRTSSTSGPRTSCPR